MLLLAQWIHISSWEVVGLLGLNCACVPSRSHTGWSHMDLIISKLIFNIVYSLLKYNNVVFQSSLFVTISWSSSQWQSCCWGIRSNSQAGLSGRWDNHASSSCTSSYIRRFGPFSAWVFYSSNPHSQTFFKLYLYNSSHPCWAHSNKCKGWVLVAS